MNQRQQSDVIIVEVRCLLTTRAAVLIFHVVKKVNVSTINR